jgi:hypothetical protein
MKRILFIATLLVSVAGCMKDTNVNPEEKVPLSLTPSISIEATKALIDYTNIESQQIGIHVSNASGDALYDNQAGNNNISLSFGTSWNLGNTVYLSASKAKIFAYSPYSATAGDLTGTGATTERLLDIPASQIMNNQTDYLWAAQDKTTPAGSTDISNENASVELKLNHSLAQVAFVVWKENFFGEGVISQITITDNTIPSNLKINKAAPNDLKMKLADGTITGGQSSQTLAVTCIGSTISLNSDPETTDPVTLNNLVNAYVLLVPATIDDKSKIQFTFKIDSKDYIVSLAGATQISFAQGNQYIYSVKLSGTALNITGVTVTEWNRNYGGPIIIK